MLYSLANRTGSSSYTSKPSSPSSSKLSAYSGLLNGLGVSAGAEAADTSALSKKDRLSMIQEEVQKFAPSKRAAAFNTINKVWENEMDRIGEYIKEKDPDWAAWGDEFDVSILDDYKAGVNMWV